MFTLILPAIFLLFLAFPSPSVSSSFPSGKCSVRNCVSSPYAFRWVQDPAVVLNSSFCFEVTQAPSCTEDYPSWCCTTLKNNANKVMMTSPPACLRSVRQVTWNGLRLGGGVYFDLLDNNTRGEFRITNLRSNFWTMYGSVFCIQADAPCNTVQSFCGGDTGCKMTFYDVDAHVCCPTCSVPTNTNNTNTSTSHNR